MVPSPTQSGALTALRGFLLSVLPTGAAQGTGTISGNTLTVSAVGLGSIALGDAVLGQYVQAGTFVTAILTGAGGVGTYTVNIPQTVPPPGLTGGQPFWTGVPVVLGQTNRVPEPKQADFVVYWPLLKRRLSTNKRTSNDVAFTASVAGNTMTVSAMTAGIIAPGQRTSGNGVAAGTKVLAQLSGTSGGVGTYRVTPAQTLGSRLLTTGQELVLEPTEYTVQIDVHGPNSADNAQVISSLFRDLYGTETFAAMNPNVQPLHADDPRQIPFTNGENQYENRWVITAVLQTNETVAVPAQFADQANITTINVEEAFPA